MCQRGHHCRRRLLGLMYLKIMIMSWKFSQRLNFLKGLRNVPIDDKRKFTDFKLVYRFQVEYFTFQNQMRCMPGSLPLQNSLFIELIKLTQPHQLLQPPTHVCVQSHFSRNRLTLCNLDPLDCSPPGSSVQGILQARILEWVAMPSSRASSRPRDRTHISYVSCMGASWEGSPSTCWTQ